MENNIHLQYLKLLFGNDRALKKYLSPSDTQWSENHYHAVSCLEGILLNEHNGTSVEQEFVRAIKDIVLNIVSSSLYLNNDKLYQAKVSK